MPGSIARTTAIMPLAIIHIACSATHEVAGDGRYPNCADLGDLSLLSDTREDAEQRMRVRVRELGGDTLLFGERGRSGRLSDSPDEIVERRNELLATVAAGDVAQPAIATASERSGEPEAPEGAQTNAERRRNAAIAAETIADRPGQLWFYGAALRCGSTDSVH